MGTSTDAILAYGIDLGDPDGYPESWKVDGIDEEALEHEDGLAKYVENRLLVAAGFTEKRPEEDLSDNWRERIYRPWRQRRDAAVAQFGVEVVSHCSTEAPMYLLVAHHITAPRGCPRFPDVNALNLQRIHDGWDQRIADALKTLGWSTDQQPRWILCSDWG